MHKFQAAGHHIQTWGVATEDELSLIFHLVFGTMRSVADDCKKDREGISEAGINKLTRVRRCVIW